MTTPQRPLLLRAQALTKVFNRPSKVEILKNIDLTVEHGDTYAIMGASGEGKSTLLHILGTLDQPSSGTLELMGHDTAKCDPSKIRNRHIGFIFQAFYLLEDYTALENVLMPAKIGRQPIHKGSDAYEHALLLLEEVGLGHRTHFPSKLLSGGERQRVAIARALCNDPELLLADEPSGNLDHHTSRLIHDLLLHFVENHRKTLIIVTHDRDLAQLCKSTYQLQDGLLHKES
jgi:lipoprotein-releasing system ATP-binding protein